jgi:hypothetical protein
MFIKSNKFEQWIEENFWRRRIERFVKQKNLTDLSSKKNSNQNKSENIVNKRNYLFNNLK